MTRISKITVCTILRLPAISNDISYAQMKISDKYCSYRKIKIIWYYYIYETCVRLIETQNSSESKTTIDGLCIFVYRNRLICC